MQREIQRIWRKIKKHCKEKYKIGVEINKKIAERNTNGCDEKYKSIAERSIKDMEGNQKALQRKIQIDVDINTKTLQIEIQMDVDLLISRRTVGDGSLPLPPTKQTERKMILGRVQI